MPARSNITLNDREATPVAHVFKPSTSPVMGLAKFLRAITSGILYGAEALTASVRQSSGRSKARMAIAMPVVVQETINGVVSSVLSHTNYCEVIFNYDKKSTDQERKNLVTMTYNALAPAQTALQAVFVDLEEFY